MPPQPPLEPQSVPTEDTASPNPQGYLRPLIIGAVVLVALGGAWYVWQSRSSDVANLTPKTIGIIGIPQVKEADEGFESKLKELGYTNATFLTYHVVPGPNMGTDVEKAVRELIEQNADLIFTDFETPAKVAIGLTRELNRTDIPIIFISRLHDPVTYGLIQSFESSGNNATGVATNIIDLIQRHMEFIKQISPQAKKLGIFGKGFQIPDLAAEYYTEVRKQAPNFGLEIVEYATNAPPPQAKAEFDRIAATVKKGDFDAMMHIAGHFYVTQEAGESKLAIRLGVPMATNYEDIPRGGHFTYSNGTRESGEQAAVMADKIFRGTEPSEIPIEYAQKSTLSLHLGRAREAGIQFPESMLFLAENKYEDSQFPSFEDH